MKYSSGEILKIGDLVSYKGLTLKANQVCNDCLIILGGDDGKRYGCWGSKGLSFKGRSEK